MKVEEYGRLLYLVTSESRKNMVHLVDIEKQDPDEYGNQEPYACSCESFNLRLDRPCKHCIAVLEHLLPVVEHLSHWQPKKPKSSSPSKITEKKTRNYVINAHDLPNPNLAQRKLPPGRNRQPPGVTPGSSSGLRDDSRHTGREPRELAGVV